MTRYRLLLIVLQAVFGLAAGGQSSLCPTAPEKTLAYELTLVHSQVKADDKVFVHLTVKNVSSTAVPLWVENTNDPGGLNYQFEVRDSQGALVPEAHFSRALRGVEDPHFLTSETPLNRSGGCIDLGAGQSRTYTIDVSRLYQMTSPGAYTIVAVDRKSTGLATALSNPVTVTAP